MRVHQIFSIVILLLLNITSGCCQTKRLNLQPQQLASHIREMGVKPTPKIVLVDTARQLLTILEGNSIKTTYSVSTSKYGLGQRLNTFRTPQGLHRISEKIGAGIPKYGIFHRRNYIGVQWKKQPRHLHKKDYISTRILRLEGLEAGFNRGRDFLGRLVDTEERAVYIHGTTMEWLMGVPSTKGCVHMKADDVIRLFNELPVGTLVYID